MKEHNYENDNQYRDFVINTILTAVTSIDIFKGRYDRFDLKYLPKNGNKERFMEIKHRNFNHNKYSDTIIELDKYQAITASTKYVADTDLLILFEDGYIVYTPNRLNKCYLGEEIKYCPDQYDGENDKWCEKNKVVVKIKIEEKYFQPYDKIRSN